MPGLDRKSRLIADWSVEILFPRDLAEMGQLGHPPPLDDRRISPTGEPQVRANSVHADDVAPALRPAAICSQTCEPGTSRR